MQTGYVIALQIQKNKELPFEIVPAIDLVEGKGITGDCHNNGGEKQITLLPIETRDWILEQDVKGLCFTKFQGNIMTKDMDLLLLSKGDLIISEQAVLEVTECSKKCYLECTRMQEKLMCKLRTGVIFAKVIQSGTIKNGDMIQSNFEIKDNCSN